MKSGKRWMPKILSRPTAWFTISKGWPETWRPPIFRRRGPKKRLSKQKSNQIFGDLEKALQAALASVRVLGSSVPEKPAKLSRAALAEIPSELAKKAADQIRDAVEMGDVTRIRSIVGDLKSKSDAFAPVGDKFIQMAADFDFDGILKLADQLAVTVKIT
jgi:hypothetical protein